jgi:membrane-bound lytic murein transglycosylase D
MQYLAKQFQRFGNWEMALASYNCGPGTINNAMKRARSNNYWTISKYLPRETRNFVPAFLGAAYIGNFYHLHDIEPDYPSLDMQVTEALKVFERLDFRTIAAVTALPIEVVSELNPAYKKDFIPENTEGYDVILPRRVSSAMAEYLEVRRPDSPRKIEMPPMPELPDTAIYKPEELYFSSVYVVAEGDKIGDLAEVFNIAPYNLKVWNKLTTYQLKKGQELTIWFPSEFHHFLPKEERIEVLPVAEAVNTTVVETIPEEVFERDNLPLPDEMPATVPFVKSSPANAQALKVVTAPSPIISVPTRNGNKGGKVAAPLKDIKGTAPKIKGKATPTAPKKVPIVPKRAPEQNGHGII